MTSRQWLEHLAPFYGIHGQSQVRSISITSTGEDNGDAHLKRQLLRPASHHGCFQGGALALGDMGADPLRRVRWLQRDKRILVKVVGLLAD